MARVNVYLPDDLAAEVKTAGLNVSSVTQEALRAELSGRRTNEWLDRIAAPREGSAVSHEQVLAAIHDAREELGRFE